MPVQKSLVEQWGWGCYPAGYNRAVHGPYDPARYYGPPDTKLAETKVSELGKWIGRRDKTPRAFTAMWSRFVFRWYDKFINPRNSGVAPYIQFIVGLSTLYYIGQYNSLRKWPLTLEVTNSC